MIKAVKMIKTAVAAFAATAMVAAGLTLAPLNVNNAYAEESVPSQQITVEVQGKGISVTFDKSQLPLVTNKVIGYQYLKPTGDWWVVACKDYIDLDALFEQAGALKYWKENATLKFECTDGAYTKYYPTYDECQGEYFYTAIPSNGAGQVDTSQKESVPTTIAFSYAQIQIPEGMTSGDVIQAAEQDEYEFTKSTRFGVGCNDATINLPVDHDANMGRRLPYDVTKITILP